MIGDYLNHVVELLSSIGSSSADAYITPVGDNTGLLDATVVYESCILRIALTVEMVPGYFAWLYYSFHCQAHDGTCIFRYDMAPHHPEIPTYPHHKHLGSEDQVLPSDQPAIHRIRLDLMQHLGLRPD